MILFVKPPPGRFVQEKQCRHQEHTERLPQHSPTKSVAHDALASELAVSILAASAKKAFVPFATRTPQVPTQSQTLVRGDPPASAVRCVKPLSRLSLVGNASGCTFAADQLGVAGVCDMNPDAREWTKARNVLGWPKRCKLAHAFL